MEDLLRFIAVTETDGSGESTVDTLVENTEPTIDTNTESTATETNPVIDRYSIDGEEFSVDEIREWRKGNMRQSDYTKKTTELSTKRKEMNEAIELYEYLSSKPELVAKLSELDVDNPEMVGKAQKTLDPVAREIKELKQQMLIKDIDSELSSIMQKDKTVSDVELLEIANEMKVPLSTAYDLWRGRNMDKVLKEREIEIRRSLTQEIKKNTDITRTIINPTDNNNGTGDLGLTDEQTAFADRVGMSAEDYKKYMTNPW